MTIKDPIENSDNKSVFTNEEFKKFSYVHSMDVIRLFNPQGSMSHFNQLLRNFVYYNIKQEFKKILKEIVITD